MRRAGIVALSGSLVLVPIVAVACGDDGSAADDTLPPIVTTTTTTTTIATTTTIQSTYVVEPKDTLFGIAKRFGLTQAAILAANPQITNPDEIDAGTELKLPQPGDPLPSTSAAPTSAAETTSPRRPATSQEP